MQNELLACVHLTQKYAVSCMQRAIEFDFHTARLSEVFKFIERRRFHLQ